MIYLAQRLAIAHFSRAQVTLLLQAVQQGVEGTGADAITVAGQFLHHAEPEGRLFGCVVQHMQADQAGVEIPVLTGGDILEFRFRHAITNTVSIRRAPYAVKPQMAHPSRMLKKALTG